MYYLPESKNFSELEYGEKSYLLSAIEIDWTEANLEEVMLSMLKELKTDRDRVIFLLMTMAKDGYIFKHKDISDMFGIDYSWYMRIVRNIKTQLSAFNDEPLPKTTRKSVKVTRIVKKSIRS